MDPRKAYAIANPARTVGELRAGHRARIHRRFETQLWCDGGVWRARVWMIGHDFMPMRYASAPADVQARMRDLAGQLLIAGDCGGGRVSFDWPNIYAIEATREMMPSEQAALAWPSAS